MGYKLQKTLTAVSRRLDIIGDEINDIKAIAEKIQQMVASLLYKEGIEKIDAAYETFMKGANNLSTTLKSVKQILSLCHVYYYRNFENYVFELETNANQHFKASKIVEYLEIVKKKDFEASISYFIYVIAARLIFEFHHQILKSRVLNFRAKYLQLLSVFYIHKRDKDRVLDVRLTSTCNLLKQIYLGILQFQQLL